MYVHKLSLHIQISEEEDAAGQGPSPSTVTDEMSEDVDPAHHVPVSGPPPQTTDQISAVSHISQVSFRPLQSHSLSLKIVSSLAIYYWRLETCNT